MQIICIWFGYLISHYCDKKINPKETPFYNVRSRHYLCQIFIMFLLSWNVKSDSEYQMEYYIKYKYFTAQCYWTFVWMIYIFTIPSHMTPRNTIHFNRCVGCLEIHGQPKRLLLAHSSYITHLHKIVNINVQWTWFLNL